MPPERIEGGGSPFGASKLGTAIFCLQQYGRKYGPWGNAAVVDGGSGVLARHPVGPLPALPELAPPPVPPSEKQAEGTIIHAGIAHTYARRAIERHGFVTAAGHYYDKADQLLPPMEAMAAEHADLTADGRLSLDLHRLQRCVNVYFDYYRETWKVLHVEDVFYAAVRDPDRRGPPPGGYQPWVLESWAAAGLTHDPSDPNELRAYIYTGRADLVVGSQGKAVIVDHKGMPGTGKNPVSLAKEYEMSLQMIGWDWMGRLIYGDRFGGVILNLVGRDPPFPLARPPMDTAWERIRQFPLTIIDGHRRLDDMYGRKLSEYTPQLSGGGGCMGRWGGCPVVESCKHAR